MTTFSELTEYFKEGFNAYQDGKERDSCAYPHNSDACLEWDEGWVTGINDPDYIKHTFGYDQLSF